MRQRHKIRPSRRRDSRDTRIKRYRDKIRHIKDKVPSGALYYWAYESESRTLVGPADTHEQAQEMAYTKTGGQFEIVGLRTRSRPAAAQMIKARLFGSSHDLKDSLKNLSHK
ncbi:hypothetical protein LCGC14_0744920 [marine sediment metagenome]|uniref:Uncharacterized protein n=1 Tax=marine sediment metagenome TaxID=412755 RepID=A0A0F9Q9Y1_9ZZZZ